MCTKILIVKLGYSETLDPEIGRVPSLGDVLRTTPILRALKEKYPDSHITWLVTEHAEQLLLGNSLIDRIMVWDGFVPFQLMKEKFDVLINLEKIAGVCALSDMIDAWVKYGFRFDSNTGCYHGYEKGLDFISYIEGKKSDKNKGYWQQVLIQMLGVPWNEQEYMVGYTPKSEIAYDFGFNYEVGSKWPYKALPMETWKELEQRLVAAGYSVSWQQGNKNLYQYMDWIHSCRTIISNDSLGLHLAFAFRKKVLGVFGPTDPNEVYFYNGCRVIRSPVGCEQMPCGAPKCQSGQYCMTHITCDSIEKAARELLPSSQES
ncbi:glycosyltransferase family 9 protein [Citrifermentans bremense]|uniref:glycosyltransferase family 9 protein n=1 Tax=Citrifermentans bremense TaxID=60035 RepID=UPI0003F502B0|nr:glycosyltransferase family 9 protein [Citrifermentans bremense]